MITEQHNSQRAVPRFPLPKEKIKFIFEEGERVFAVRDISLSGLGISLLEHGEVLLFPVGYRCGAELKLDGEPIQVEVRVARHSAWAVGFTFEDLGEELQHKLDIFLNPMWIGQSLKPVNISTETPDLFASGIARWYHGDSATDLYLWHDARGGVERALFCLGDVFWEWSEADGLRTGALERMAASHASFHYHSKPQRVLIQRVRKILEHSGVLDYRLANFLKEQCSVGEIANE